MSDDLDQRPPLFRVVAGGEPAAEDVAALAAALAVRAAADATSPVSRVSRWSDRAALLRRPLRPGPGAWVASARS